MCLILKIEPGYIYRGMCDLLGGGGGLDVLGVLGGFGIGGPAQNAHSGVKRE